MIQAISISSHVRDFRTALEFLTRLPAGSGRQHEKNDLASASWAFAPVGLLVGGIAGAAIWAASGAGLHPLAAALIGLGVQALITGALHEDGLADMADGLGAGPDKSRALEIMRDSRIGTYGVLALLFSVGIRAALIAGVPGPGWAWASLAAAAALSRGFLPALIYALPPARPDGLGQGAGRPTGRLAMTAAVLGVVIIYALLPAMAATVAILLAGMAVVAIGVLAHRRLGGQTGDVLGAAQQCCEVAVLVATAAWIGDYL